MTDFVCAPDGTSIGFDRHGAGVPVVLCGGMFQHRAIDPDTARLAQALGADGFEVAHYDRRGRGDSTDTQPYAVDREIEDLAAVVEALGGHAHAFGMSSGGLLVLEAARAGVALDTVAVYECPARTASATSHDPELIPGIEAACAAGRPADAIAAMIGPEAVDGLRATPAWEAFAAVAPTLAYDARVVDRSCGADRRFDPSRYAGLDRPVLVLNGAEGFDWMAEGADQLAAAVPNARRETLAGQDHRVDVDVLGPVLAAFFA